MKTAILSCFICNWHSIQNMNYTTSTNLQIMPRFSHAPLQSKHPHPHAQARHRPTPISRQKTSPSNPLRTAPKSPTSDSANTSYQQRQPIERCSCLGRARGERRGERKAKRKRRKEARNSRPGQGRRVGENSRRRQWSASWSHAGDT